MTVLVLTLDELLELGIKPDPQKLKERLGSQVLKSVALQVLDDKFWELVQEGKTAEEAFNVLGLGMPKGGERKPEIEKAAEIL